MKYVPIPKSNDDTHEDARVYVETRITRGESLETVAKRMGVTPAELQKFEAGEGQIIDDDEELWQLPNGDVRFGPVGTREKPKKSPLLSLKPSEKASSPAKPCRSHDTYGLEKILARLKALLSYFNACSYRPDDSYLLGKDLDELTGVAGLSWKAGAWSEEWDRSFLDHENAHALGRFTLALRAQPVASALVGASNLERRRMDAGSDSRDCLSRAS